MMLFLLPFDKHILKYICSTAIELYMILKCVLAMCKRLVDNLKICNRNNI